jgi:hypothetical protein
MTHCLEASRNGMLCKGAEEYESRLNKIERVVDKIRYSMSHTVERINVKELLDMFAADSGRFIDNMPKNKP